MMNKKLLLAGLASGRSSFFVVFNSLYNWRGKVLEYYRLFVSWGIMCK